MSQLLMTGESFHETPSMDIAISHALLDAVAKRSIGAVFRLHTPTRVLAFGMADRIQPGYQHAVRSAAAHRFHPVERLAGGRAAVFHESTLAFSMATPEDDSRSEITDRFVRIASMLNEAFRSLGLDTRVGQVDGEYCPGEYSVNLIGRTKVMGVGQRLVKGAAHVGGVIVVDGAASIRDVLIPVYRALGIDWDPRTVGALADRSPGLDNSRVAAAVTRQLEARFDVERYVIPQPVKDQARILAADHLPKVA